MLTLQNSVISRALVAIGVTLWSLECSVESGGPMSISQYNPHQFHS